MSIQKGNAAIDGQTNRNWIVGDFIDPIKGLRHSEDVEIKWGVHKAGETRADWVTAEARTTIGILISGRFEMIFRDETVELSTPGDYVMWGLGTDHTWRVTEDTVIVTVRWPSRPTA